MRPPVAFRLMTCVSGEQAILFHRETIEKPQRATHATLAKPASALRHDEPLPAPLPRFLRWRARPAAGPDFEHVFGGLFIALAVWRFACAVA